MAEYHSISDLVKLSINNKQELWQVVLTEQAHDKLMSERDVFAQMKKMYQAMKSADEQYAHGNQPIQHRSEEHNV